VLGRILGRVSFRATEVELLREQRGSNLFNSKVGRVCLTAT